MGVMGMIGRSAVAALAMDTAGCHCANGAPGDMDSTGMSSDSSTSSGLVASTGEPFDVSRWIGRYHYENVLLPFGERGDPGDPLLINFEIFDDSTAVMVHDHCSFDEAVRVAYRWTPNENGTLELHPGAGESSLRFIANEAVESIRVRLIEPCRALELEIDDKVDSTIPFHPGESCWVDRCTTPGIMQVDYCEGEEPPPCP